MIQLHVEENKNRKKCNKYYNAYNGYHNQLEYDSITNPSIEAYHYETIP